ncbi:colicin release lysis protein [Proteus mirabilis]
MSGGYSFIAQGVCMKKIKWKYWLLCLISLMLLTACQASYVRDVSGSSVNTSNPVLSGNQTTVK